MAKKKLFGNQSEPRCDTCALGKASSDNDLVLCRRNGAVAPDHHCRRYTYDPLKRIPKRAPLPPEFSAADFALDDIMPPEYRDDVTFESDNTHDRLLRKLRDYLNETDSPDVQTIFDLLSEIPEAESGTADNDDDDSDNQVPDTAQTADDPAAPAAANTLIPDETPDIFGDLERLIVNVSTGSTTAAFRDFDIRTVEGDEVDADLIDDGSLYTSDMLALEAGDDPEDDSPLDPNDLLFLPADSPEDTVVDALRMNEDGSISLYKDSV